MFTRNYLKTKIRLLFLVVVILTLFITSCSKKASCEELSTQFKTYEIAVNKIKSTNFKIEESANTSKSSWIKKASYYSCDGKLGYFIFETKKNEYIHIDVPISVWIDFKSAVSLGSFYNKNIKHRYIFYQNK